MAAPPANPPANLPRDSHDRLLLRDDHIIETIAKLQRRISERFPDAGLARLCGQLLEIARQASTRSAGIGRPILSIRITGYLLAIMLIVILVEVLVTVAPEIDQISLTEFVQTSEAATSLAVLLGAAIYFLVSLETRIKRRRALAALHELRSIAHIIDMHQLTKDPERMLRHWQGTDNSPQPGMSPLQLNRYLDYCSEMLSLTGKIAALYVRKFDDSVAVATVSEVEQLTTGLSRKIWQKIMSTHAIEQWNSLLDLRTREGAGAIAPSAKTPLPASTAGPTPATSTPATSTPADEVKTS